MITRWCRAGSNPRCLAHSVKLLRIVRRQSNSCAAARIFVHGKLPAPARLLFVFAIEANLDQLLVGNLAQIDIARGPYIGATLGFDLLNVPQERTLRRDVALRSCPDQAANHGPQSRYPLELAAFAHAQQAINLLPDKFLGALVFGRSPFATRVA